MDQIKQAKLTRRYDQAAALWGDKMRTLGYYDGYLGFLTSQASRPNPGSRVLDVGCGSGAFSEAWAAVFGSAVDMTLLDPSDSMLARADAALAWRGVTANLAATMLEDFRASAPFDHLLAAHVIEHCPEPGRALRQMRDQTVTGGKLWLVASRPHWCNAIIWLKWQHRTFQDAEVSALLTQSGWELVETYAFPSGPPSRTSRGYIAQAI